MKNLKVWLVFLPLLTIACTDDSSTEITETAQEFKGVKKKVGISPRNTANPYDLAGSAHNDILDIIDDTSINSYSIEDIAAVIDSISALNPDLALFPNDTTVSSKLSEITWIVNDNDAITEVLTTSTLGNSAKSSLTSFVNSLLLATDDPYEDIYAMIVGYETNVINSTGFTSEEKQILLTTTSVVRYSVYRKKREDKDWDTSVGNIAATVSGAEEGLVLGLKMAVTVGLCQNHNITQ